MTDSSAGRRPVGRIDETFFRAWNNWVAFWFTPADPAPLGVMRILVGGMLVYSHLVWGMDLAAFLGPDGWNSGELVRELQKGSASLSFWWHVPAESMLMVHRCCIAILILFCLGCLTRVTSVLAFMIHVSYCQRAVMSNYGLDQILGILLLYLMIGPSGAAYSIDHLCQSWWRRTSTPVGRSSAAQLSLRLIQIHYCVIYFSAATAKMSGDAWWAGHAVWRTISNYEYQSVDLTWLAWYPEVLQLLTHVVLLWELSFAYLIWVRPLRPLMLTVGVLMHLGIGVFLGMWTFGLTMIFGYIAFLKPETVRAFLSWPRQSAQG